MRRPCVERWRWHLRLIGYMARRILEMIPVLLGITLLAFLFMQLLPGDPITILTGGKATPETIAALRGQVRSG